MIPAVQTGNILYTLDREQGSHLAKGSGKEPFAGLKITPPWRGSRRGLHKASCLIPRQGVNHVPGLSCGRRLPGSAGVPPAQGLAQPRPSPVLGSTQRRLGSPSTRPLRNKDAGGTPALPGQSLPLERESQKPSRRAKADAVGGESRPTSSKKEIHEGARRTMKGH